MASPSRLRSPLRPARALTAVESPPRAERRAHRAWRPAPGLLALALCLAAFLGAAAVATVIFDRLPHVEDEVAFLFQARTLAAGRLTLPAPAEPDFFYLPFVLVHDGQWFGKYPPGYPAVLALGLLSGQPWLLNPLAGALCVGLTFLLGRRLYNTAAGLLAAALLATSPFLLIQAGSFLSHVASLAWALLALLLAEWATRRRSALAAAGVGLACGALLLTRPLTALGLGLPLAVWLALTLARDRRLALVWLPALATFGACLAALLGYNHLTTGDPLRSAYELWWPVVR
jgi:hypothetical protein